MNNYKEDIILNDLKGYIEDTYKEHYQSKSLQLIDLFASEDLVIGYLKSSIMKYVLRYGKKGGFNYKDLYKAIHCTILLLYFTRYYKSENSLQILTENQ